MKNMDTVYGFAGHSIIPALALIHSNVASRYVFMFTEELEVNRSIFEAYLEQKAWEDKAPEISLRTIGSIGDFSNNYKQIQQTIDTNQSFGLFLQNGAKQLILATILQYPDAPRIYLEEPFTLKKYERLNFQSERIVTLSPKEAIQARGVALDDALLKNTTVEFDERGRIQFTKAMKKLTESDVSSIVQLIGKFGRNGAVYRLDYRYASRRIRNTVPPFVVCLQEEEE